METAASFEVRNAPSSYPTVNCLRSHAESAKMGRLGPYNNTTAPIACSVRAQTFTFSVLFEVPFNQFAVYVFDYGAPTGFRLAVRHPERITAIISQNGNAYEEGLSDGWSPIRAYWQEPSQANRKALRAFLTPKTTRWQYTQGVPDPTLVSPRSEERRV